VRTLFLCFTVALMLPCFLTDPSPQTEPAGKQGAQKKALATDLYGDPLPAGAIARMGTVRLRHAGEVRSVVFTPNGKSLITQETFFSDEIILWDVATGRESRRIKAESHTGGPFAVSPDGKTLANAEGHAIYLRELASGKVLGMLTKQDWPSITSLAFSSDGQTLASGSGGRNYTVRLWDVATGKERHRLLGHQGAVTCVRFSPDGRTLASADSEEDPTIRLWDTATGKPRTVLRGQTLPFFGSTWISFSPDGKWLASAGTDAPHKQQPTRPDATVRLWDVAGGRELRVLKTGNEAPTSVAFSPDGKTLVASVEGAILLLDPESGKEVRRLHGPKLPLYSVAYSPDGNSLAAACGHAIRLWEVSSGKERFAPAAEHLHQLDSIALSPDGKTLATASLWDKTTWLWDAASGKPLRGLDTEGDQAAAFSTDGKTLAAGGWTTVRLWDPESGRELWRAENNERSVGFLVFSADGKRLVCDGNGNVRLWDTTNGQELQRIMIPVVQRVVGLAFGPQERTLVVWDDFGNLYLLDTAKGKELRSPKHMPHGWGQFCNVALHPGGRFFAGAIGRYIEFYDLKMGRELRPHRGMVLYALLELSVGRPLSADPSSLAFSQDGRTLAVGDSWGHVQLIETATGRKRHEFTGSHKTIVKSVAFSGDGRRLASGGWDAIAYVWDLTGQSQRGKSVALSPADLKRLWDDLASEDGSKAYAAVWTLTSDPARSVPFLRKRLRPVVPTDQGQIARWVADLDSPQFMVRDTASDELRRMGELAGPALRLALSAKPSEETRRRADLLLKVIERKELEVAPRERWRPLRAVEALEFMATAEARQFLAELADGAPGAWLTREAQATLGRLLGRTTNP
jgi:WD40 repeat protein